MLAYLFPAVKRKKGYVAQEPVGAHLVGALKWARRVAPTARRFEGVKESWNKLLTTETPSHRGLKSKGLFSVLLTPKVFAACDDFHAANEVS
jgi:hypothetical protein